jgi:diguanylate cyclase (GGDEF)-like protein
MRLVFRHSRHPKDLMSAFMITLQAVISRWRDGYRCRYAYAQKESCLLSVEKAVSVTITEYLGALPKSVLLVCGSFLLALVSVGDYLTHAHYVLEFSPFYLVPISFFSWFIGRRSGFALGILSVMIGFFIRLRQEPRAIAYWDALVWFGLYVCATVIVVQLKALYEHERYLSRIDPLTRVGNRRSLFEAASAAKSVSDRQGVPLSISYIDLDGFKQVNDRFGHSAGDSVLAATASAIANAVRPSDVVARIGGDEFAVLLPGADGEAAISILRRVRLELDSVMMEHRWPMTFSIGIASFTPPLGSVPEMIQAADQTMYIAKKKGKNRTEHRHPAA